MSIEKRDIVHKNILEIKAFLERFKKVHLEVVDMLERGEAYFQDRKDRNNEVTSYKIFKNNGELLYYENLEGFSDSKSKETKVD